MDAAPLTVPAWVLLPRRSSRTVVCFLPVVAAAVSAHPWAEEEAVEVETCRRRRRLMLLETVYSQVRIGIRQCCSLLAPARSAKVKRMTRGKPPLTFFSFFFFLFFFLFFCPLPPLYSFPLSPADLFKSTAKIQPSSTYNPITEYSR